MFIGKWNKSVILTYIGLGFGILGIYFAFNNYSVYSLICLMIAGVCDMFDGKIARMCKRDDEEIAFGIELDSLVDVVCFVILPIIIYISLGFEQWYNILSYILFAICGIARLCYFNICTATKDGNAVKCYQGLPVTVSAISLPIFYLLSYIMSENVFFVFFSILIYVEAILNISKINIKKPTGMFYPILSFFAIVLLIVYIILI